MSKTYARGQGRYPYGALSGWVATFLVLNCAPAFGQADPPLTYAEAVAMLTGAVANLDQAEQDITSAREALAETPPNCATALGKLGHALAELGMAKGKFQEVASRLPQGLTVAQAGNLIAICVAGIASADHAIGNVQLALERCTGRRAGGLGPECCDDTGFDEIIDDIEDAIGHGKDGLGVLKSSVPTVSEWGLMVMTLLALTAATVVFGRRRRPATA